MLLSDKKQEFGGKNLFIFPIYLLFVACLPINFFYIESFNVPFLGRLLVKKRTIASISVYVFSIRMPFVYP